MTDNNCIIPCYETFMCMFPYFSDKNINEEALKCLYAGIPGIISNIKGSIGLCPKVQERAVYLALAHLLFLQLNPDAYRPVTNVQQGSESAGFQAIPTNNSLKDYYLSTSPYGLELSMILRSIQPPLPSAGGLSIYPYYNSIRGWGGRII